VNAAASIDSQSGSRAAHGTAKATSSTLVPKRAEGPCGVGAAACVEGSTRNTGDPSALPESGQGAPYQPSVKSAAAQRESEGSIVLSRPVAQNAGGGKGPGAAGVDKQTIADMERLGVGELLADLKAELQAGRYRPLAVRRRYIPQAGGKQRPLGIPAVRDRIVQMATKLVIEPIFEADFKPCSHGFRPRRSATDALETLRKRAHRDQDGNFVLDADIKGYFDNIDPSVLLELVGKRIRDRRLLKLLRQWLQAGVMEDGEVRRSTAGTPQGGVISPLLANIYLHVLDERWTREHAHLGTLVRYADDFVVMCDTAEAWEEAERVVRGILESELGLELPPEKTRRVELTEGKGGFDFLGCHLRKRMSGRRWEKYGRRRYSLQRWPSRSAMKQVRRRVRELTTRSWNRVKDVRDLIARINPVLRGWGNYFRTGNAADRFQVVDHYVWWRLWRFMKQRKGRNLKADDSARFRHDFFWGHGLHRLLGTVHYPGAA